ncbi:uncharacterized protein LOC134744897 [Cydia strobilella]|uniref:uncharacterized protein LOC134744897 n=1 Tax=Cydia strobilella TaxID=1100964 RepID=UPI003005B3C9
MAFPIKFMSLQKTELEYEVAIRGETPGDTVQELRKQIAKCGPLFPSEDILVSPFDVQDDLDSIAEVVEKVNSLLDSKPLIKSTLLRAHNLVHHLYHRLNRIACEDKEQKEAYDRCVALFRVCTDRVNSLNVVTVTDPLFSNSSIVPVVAATSSTPVNVTVTCEANEANKLSKLKYDGSSCVRAFIERVSEFCLAKNISSSKVLHNGTEIFTGGALHWFRSVKEQVTSWDDLVVLLKQDFGQADYDYRLVNEIKSRTQGETENIIIYLSVMSGLFSRLTRPLPEEEKLEILLHNIRPCYTSTLSSVSEIKSIEQLKMLCRNYESIQSRLSHFKEPPRATADTLAPEFAYSGSSSKPKPNFGNNTNFNNNKPNYNRFSQNQQYNRSFTQHNNINNNNSKTKPNYVDAITPSTSKTRYCPRCRVDTHNLRQCTASKDILVCFGCGRKNVKAPDCPDCNKNKKPSQKN